MRPIFSKIVYCSHFSIFFSIYAYNCFSISPIFFTIFSTLACNFFTVNSFSEVSRTFPLTLLTSFQNHFLLPLQFPNAVSKFTGRFTRNFHQNVTKIGTECFEYISKNSNNFRFFENFLEQT